VTVVGTEEGHQVPELVFVDVTTGPDEIHSNGVPVIHGVEEVVQSLGSDDITFTHQAEWRSALDEPSVSVQSHHVKNFVQVLIKRHNILSIAQKIRKFLIYLVVVLVVQADGLRVLQEVLVVDVILNMTQQIDDELLMFAITIVQVTIVPVVGVPVASRSDGNKQRYHK
jgi:hypothetical protein